MSSEEPKTAETKVEETPPVVATEALAAAAAAAVNATADAAVDMDVASPTPASGRVSLLNEVDQQGKRRFFPRVKHLIGNKEWEEFLTQVLQCIEEAGAPETAAASHKANNAWYKAFDLIYGGVAREYSIPTGKNRYHKFKDKILEVWQALEQQAPGENHCREVAMEQYERYRKACAEANKNGGALQTPSKIAKTAAGQSAKLAGGKRSYSAAMGGGSFLSVNNSGYLWKNIDESAQLEKLPIKLRKLVHLKQLSKEMAALTTNRPARKGVDEHSKKLDASYMEALTEYLGVQDVEMSDEAKDDETTTEAEAYEKSLVLAFLYRYSSTLQEQKILSEAFCKSTAKCVTFPVEEEPADDEAAAVAATAAAAAIEEGFAPVQI